MKLPIRITSLLLMIGVLLAACTAAVQDENLSGESAEEQPSLAESNNKDVAGPEVEENPMEEEEAVPIIAPTSSPLFEQDYGPNEISDRDYSVLEIITLLPPDAIPAISNAEYYSVREANQEYAPEELVIGVEFNGDARAYSVSLLSRHEIVNETVGGVKIAVTW
jgi:hypothetical protein